MKPEISVIMSVYDTEEKYLRIAIESILNQSYGRFEFIIVLDYPKDNSKKIVKDYQKSDERIIILENERNIGLTKSLNRALSIARGKYIARMDADDYAIRKRLAIQFDFLEKNIDVGVVGGHVFTGIPGSRFLTGWNKNKSLCVCNMLFHNSGVPHPTAMFRRELSDGFQMIYDEKIKKSQDYALWSECIWHTNIVLLDEVLLIYRIHDGQISSMPSGQIECSSLIIKKQFENLFGGVSSEVLSNICSIYLSREFRTTLEIKNTFKYLETLNDEKRVIKQRVFKKFLKEIRSEYIFMNRNIISNSEKNWIFTNIDLIIPSNLYSFFVEYILKRKKHDYLCKRFQRFNRDEIYKSGIGLIC